MKTFYRYGFLFIMLIIAIGLTNCKKNKTDTTDPQQQDIDQYEQLTTQLEANRIQLLGSQAMEITAYNNRLFWLEFPGYDPYLHSYNTQNQGQTAYSYSIGGGGAYNYRASANAIVTAIKSGQDLYFKAYSVDASNNSLGQLTVTAPVYGQAWWAYSVSGNNMYYVTTGSQTVLHKWIIGQANSTVVLTFETDMGVNMGEFLDLAVSGDTMIFVESGRIWMSTISNKTATWLGNNTQVTGNISYDHDGILYETATAPMYYQYSNHQNTNVADLINNNSYKLNNTYSAAHHYVEGAVKYKNYVVYKGQYGVFSYNLSTGAIKPILLDPREYGNNQSLNYKYPTITDGGYLFIQGLIGSAGSVGADGPIYMINPDKWMQ